METERPKYRKGQALVETALVLFIVVLFTFGITEFGRAMYIKNMLNNTARSAVRQAVVTGSLTLPITYPTNSFTTRPDPSTDPIGAKIYDGLMYLTPSDKNQVTASVNCSAGCSGANAVNGATITVTVIAPFRSYVQLIQISNTLAGQASMRYE